MNVCKGFNLAVKKCQKVFNYILDCFVLLEEVSTSTLLLSDALEV